MTHWSGTATSLQWPPSLVSPETQACSRILVYYKLLGPYKIRTRISVPCPVWHRPTSRLSIGQTRQQSKQLNSIQRRACQIILNDDRTYSDACTVLGLPSLHDRRHKLCRRLFQQLAHNTDNCLCYLLPDMWLHYYYLLIDLDLPSNSHSSLQRLIN